MIRMESMVYFYLHSCSILNIIGEKYEIHMPPFSFQEKEKPMRQISLTEKGDHRYA